MSSVALLSLKGPRMTLLFCCRVPLETGAVLTAGACSFKKASEKKQQPHHKEAVSHNNLMVNHGCGLLENTSSPSPVLSDSTENKQTKLHQNGQT